uniref:Uncharacterized protein n=1 Tax=Anguilla anguilla TaxID=7936 RepID=A0A0E9PFH6_ANGAN
MYRKLSCTEHIETCIVGDWDLGDAVHVPHTQTACSSSVLFLSAT